MSLSPCPNLVLICETLRNGEIKSTEIHVGYEKIVTFLPHEIGKTKTSIKVN